MASGRFGEADAFLVKLQKFTIRTPFPSARQSLTAQNLRFRFSGGFEGFFMRAGLKFQHAGASNTGIFVI
jgi:hypothetical protein